MASLFGDTPNLELKLREQVLTALPLTNSELLLLGGPVACHTRIDRQSPGHSRPFYHGQKCGGIGIRR